MIARRAVSKGLLPFLIVAGVLAASLLMRPVGLAGFNLTATCSYGYLGAPNVTGIAPTSGSTLGGQAVVITGCGFTGTTGVKFGATVATFTINSDSKITATSPAHAAGTVDVRVTTAKGTSAISAADQFTYSVVCNSVTLSAAPASPQAAGTQVTLTAVASGCPTAGPLYEFWARWSGNGGWQLLQGYSTANTYVWNSTGALPGTEFFGVWAKDATSTNLYDALASLPYTVSAPVCTSVTLTAAPASPKPSGTQVTLTAAASGCTNANPLYEFWARWSGSSTWQMLQGYTTAATYVWNSTGALAGVENFGVWAKDAKSSASYDALASIQYTVTTPVCTGVTITAVPTSVVGGSGTHVTLTAVASGCTNPNPIYRFWMRAASQSNWQLVQDWSTKATYDWNSTGAAAGIVYFGVWAEDAKSPNPYDANASTSVTVT